MLVGSLKEEYSAAWNCCDHCADRLAEAVRLTLADLWKERAGKPEAGGIKLAYEAFMRGIKGQPFHSRNVDDEALC